MRTPFFRQTRFLVMLVAAIAGCTGGGGSPVSSTPEWGQGLDQVRSAVASAGYPAEAVEVTASPVHLRISVTDAKLSQADQMTRENAASTIVSAAEGVLPGNQQLASIQSISVAIVHSGQSDGSAAATHTEDVLEFRKGPNQRFAHHIT